MATAAAADRPLNEWTSSDFLNLLAPETSEDFNNLVDKSSSSSMTPPPPPPPSTTQQQQQVSPQQVSAVSPAAEMDTTSVLTTLLPPLRSMTQSTTQSTTQSETRSMTQSVTRSVTRPEDDFPVQLTDRILRPLENLGQASIIFFLNKIITVVDRPEQTSIFGKSKTACGIHTSKQQQQKRREPLLQVTLYAKLILSC